MMHSSKKKILKSSEAVFWQIITHVKHFPFVIHTTHEILSVVGCPVIGSNHIKYEDRPGDTIWSVSYKKMA